jgi:hypothetical protein
VVCVAVLQRHILLAFSGGHLKMEVVCFFRTVSKPYDLVSVWKDNILMLFGLKCGHEMEGGGGGGRGFGGEELFGGVDYP